MPKAEATTGLAPKKASATDPLPATQSSAEGFGFRRLVSLVESRRSGGLGLVNATDRRAAFARRSFWVFTPPCGRRFGCDRSRRQPIPAVPAGAVLDPGQSARPSTAGVVSECAGAQG